RLVAQTVLSVPRAAPSLAARLHVAIRSDLLTCAGFGLFDPRIDHPRAADPLPRGLRVESSGVALQIQNLLDESARIR
ncbi:MAG: hypothetical protein NTW86_05975, partial [Candidatus Sumerlaeota bacterium]|nr:hypothetical protein [Candidatus Sumerlaeota bacterium]